MFASLPMVAGFMPLVPQAVEITPGTLYLTVSGIGAPIMVEVALHRLQMPDSHIQVLYHHLPYVPYQRQPVQIVWFGFLILTMTVPLMFTNQLTTDKTFPT